MPALKVTFDGKTIEKPITKTPITIGRQPGLDLSVPARGASREHLRIGRLKDGTWAFRDLGSTNGTLHNGKKVDTARLKHGDTLQFGDCKMEFLDAPAKEPEPEPESKPEKTGPKKPIILKSKKDRERESGDKPKKPIVLKSKKDRGKKKATAKVSDKVKTKGKDTAKEAPEPEAPPPKPEAPAELIENEEQLEGWLKRRDELELLLASGKRRFLFGKYELKRRLSEGGMGVVFKAVKKPKNITVALKILKSDRVDENNIARFKQEAWAISAFDHPNIVKVRDLAMHGGLHFIAMDFIDGEDLLAVGFKRELTFWQVAEVIDKLADVLRLVHGRNIWHRDIKPQNVILDGKGQVKLIDFGIATVEREQDDATKTAEGLIMGTPAFLSPEQAARGKMGAIDGRADLYSLGALMYYLLTGRRPFTGRSALEILANNMKKDPPPPHTLDEHVPEGLEDICLHLMRKRPADRIQSAEQLQAELARWRKTADGKEEAMRHKKIMKLREKKAKARKA
ncbi:MAG: protein kinase domain-containing protein [Planctomycetota bacterium]|jgi:predicted Ser/Thr protein kinase